MKCISDTLIALLYIIACVFVSVAAPTKDSITHPIPAEVCAFVMCVCVRMCVGSACCV